MKVKKNNKMLFNSGNLILHFWYLTVHREREREQTSFETQRLVDPERSPLRRSPRDKFSRFAFDMHTLGISPFSDLITPDSRFVRAE